MSELKHMHEVFGDRGWDELYPTDMDMSVAMHNIVQDTISIDTYDNIISSYEPDKHLDLDKGYWSDVWCNLPYPLGTCVSYYLYILGEKSYIVENILIGLELNKPVLRSVFLERTRAITDWVKRRGPRYSNEWRLMIDLSSLVGFNLTGASVEKKETMMEEWCIGKIERQSMTKVQVVKNIEKLLDAPNPRTEILSIEEFIARPDLWVTKGSGKGVKTMLLDKDNGNIVESNSNKSAVALSLTVKDILTKLYDNKVEVFAISNKIEVAGKGRVIVSPSWELNFLMAYVMHYFEPEMKRVRNDSPLWLNSDGIELMWNKFRQDVQSSKWMYPQDASKFDQTLSTDEFDALLTGIQKWINKIQNTKLKYNLNTAWGLVKRRWKSAKVRLPSNRHVKWEHGMPSGIRLTAIGDTVVSLGRTIGIVKYKQCEVSNLYGMGDDILLSGLKPYYIMDVFEETNNMGVIVNAAKNFASREHAEFLRIGVDKTTATGYPARHIVKHLFIQPGTAMPKMWRISDMRAYITSCNMLITRGCDAKVIIDNMISVLVANNNDWVKKWIYTPCCMGGCGFRPSVIHGVRPKQNEVQSKYQVTSLGAFENMTHNTLELGINIDTIKDDLSNRVVRGLPGSVFTGELKLYDVITPAEDVSLYNKVLSMLKAGIISKSKIPPYSIDETKIGVVFKDLVIDKWISDGDWEMLTQMADAKSKRYVKLFERNWERKLFIKWLRNKLPTVLPKVNGWSEQAISQVVSKSQGIIDSWLLKYHRMSFTIFNVAVMTHESAVYEYCENAQYKFGY